MTDAELLWLWEIHCAREREDRERWGAYMAGLAPAPQVLPPPPMFVQRLEDGAWLFRGTT